MEEKKLERLVSKKLNYIVEKTMMFLVCKGSG
jgi:hypothetical protein